MGRRDDLHALLKTILGSDNVYFQPPPSLKLQYPCIIYHRDFEKSQHGDNKPYAQRMRYAVTVVDSEADSTIPGKVSALELCVYDRFFTANNLNHDVFKLFF